MARLIETIDGKLIRNEDVIEIYPLENTVDEIHTIKAKVRGIKKPVVLEQGSRRKCDDYLDDLNKHLYSF